MTRCLLFFGLLWLTPLTGQMPDPFFPQVGQGLSVHALAAKGDTLYVAGDFQQLGPYFRQNIGALDIETGAILSWMPGVNGPVRGMQLHEQKLFLWGSFTSVNGQLRNNFAVLDAHTGQLDAFNPTIQFPGIPGMQTGTISDVMVSGDTVFLAGYFLKVNGQDRSNLAALTLDGQLLPWNPWTNIPVDRLLVVQEKVYVAGPFTQPRSGLLAFHRDSGTLLPWNPAPDNPGNTYGPMRQVAGSTDIWVSGPFSQLGGVSRPFLARVHESSGQPGPFTLGVAYSNPVQVVVHALSEFGGALFIGGSFATGFGGAFRQHLAVVDPSTGALDTWNPSPNGRVRAILHHHDALFVGGAFNEISGQAHRLLAAYNTFTTAQSSPDAPTAEHLRIVPNPVRDQVRLEWAVGVDELALVDANGRLVRRWEALPAGTQLLTLDGLPSGSYQLLWQAKGVRGHAPLQVLR